MASKDFDAQRTDALAHLEPIDFGLFGRRWACEPMLPPNALAWIDKVRTGSNETEVLHAGLMFVGAVVTEHDAWDVALRGAVIDGDTLLDLITWLGQEYAKRYSEPAEPKITPPTDPTATARALEVVRTMGGEIS
jgi:hypothetical protein